MSAPAATQTAFHSRDFIQRDFTLQQSLLFYLLIPAVIAMWNGARGNVHAPDMPTYRTVMLWLAVSVPTWCLSDLMCRLMYGALRKAGLEIDRIGQVVILMTGGLLACALGYFYVTALITFSGDFFGDLHHRLSPTGFGLVRPVSDVVLSLSSLLSVLIWTAINLAFDRLSQAPRFRTNAAPAPTTIEMTPEAHAERVLSEPQTPPAFLAKVPARLGQDIIAVEAHEHYIKVHTQNGSVLLLYKFKDALAELEPFDGLQVHRSHWVAKSAVAAVDESKKPVRLILKNGLEVPVSHARLSALQVAGVMPRKTG